MKASFKMYRLQLRRIIFNLSQLTVLKIQLFGKYKALCLGSILMIGGLYSYQLNAQELELSGTTKIEPGMKISKANIGEGLKLMLSNYTNVLTKSDLVFTCSPHDDFNNAVVFKEISDVSINPNSLRRLNVELPVEHLKPGQNFIFIGEKDKTPGLTLAIELAEDGDTIVAVSINDYQNTTPNNVVIILLSLIVLLLLGLIITLMLIWKKKHHTLASKPVNADAKELIRKGYLESALDTLYDCLKSTNKELEAEILFLQSQYKHYQRDKSLGMIDDNSYAIRINNITSRALILANEAV